MSSRILDDIAEEARKGSFGTGEDQASVIRGIELLKRQKLNVAFVGATGVGKSSTINSIFNMDVAKVGDRTDPETASIQKYELDNMVLWDTPGLGDNPEKDRQYAVEIAGLLKRKDEKGDLLIDEVVVLVDGSNRDMKTAYETIEHVVAPYIEDPKRIIIAINQCDVALKGRFWNNDRCEPEAQLAAFLDQKVTSVRERIAGSTGIATSPMYYSALHHYNISKLLLAMITAVQEKKRFLFTDSLNRNPEVWKKNDKPEIYNQQIQQEVKGSLSKALEGAAAGAAAGATVGRYIPVIGPIAGAIAGAALGFLGGLLG